MSCDPQNHCHKPPKTHQHFGFSDSHSLPPSCRPEGLSQRACSPFGHSQHVLVTSTNPSPRPSPQKTQPFCENVPNLFCIETLCDAALMFLSLVLPVWLQRLEFFILADASLILVCFSGFLLAMLGVFGCSNHVSFTPAVVNNVSLLCFTYVCYCACCCNVDSFSRAFILCVCVCVCARACVSLFFFLIFDISHSSLPCHFVWSQWQCCYLGRMLFLPVCLPSHLKVEYACRLGKTFLTSSTL